jgi:hypothetical protein
VLFAVSVLTPIAGCNERSRSEVTATEDSFPDALATAVCAKVFGCCEVAEVRDANLEALDIDLDDYVSEDDCRAQLAAEVRVVQARLAPDVASGRRAFNPAGGSCKVSGWRNAACGLRALRDAEDDCELAYVGTSPLGASCADPKDCAPIVDGRTECDTVSGTCQVAYRRVRVGLGDSCADSDPDVFFECPEGTYCDGLVCKAPAANGAYCTSGDGCASGRCSTGGSCEEPLRNLPNGADCGFDDDSCQSGNCGCADTACVTNVCIPPVCDGR